MAGGFLRRSLVASLFLFVPSLGFGSLALADGSPIEMDLSVLGSGSNGSGVQTETVNGTFLFDPTNGTISNFNAQGQGIISENWAFGPVSGTPAGSPGFYAYYLSSYLGSQGDSFGFVMMLDNNGGFIPPNEGCCGLNLNVVDNWSGEITPAPELSTLSLSLLGLMMVLGMMVVSRVTRRNTTR